MSKSDPIIFENPQKGMAPHPLLGIGLLRQIDVSTYPGLARLNKATAKVSGSTVTGLPYWIVRNPSNGDLYALDSGGQVYVSTNEGVSWATVAGETAGGAGQGMAIWKGYLVVARATRLDLYSLAGATWTNSWQANTGSADILDTTNDFHSMLASVDDKLYILAGRYVASITELTTFDPATSSTYTYTKRAITLPQNYNAKCIADLGANLMVGTWFGSSVLYHKVADIFPYNRTTLTLGIPIKLGENGVHALLPVGNRLYTIAGLNAKLFITDGASTFQVAEIPNYAINLLDTGYRLNVYPGAMAYHRGKILFGIDNSGTVNGNVGVWSFDPFNKQLALENLISTGNDGSTAELAIGALYSHDNEKFLIGWKDYSGGTSTGIDSKGSTTFPTSYGGAIETQLMHVGQALNNRTVQSLEFFLTKPLITGQGIRIKYRKDLTASFTTLATADYATYSGIQSLSIPAASITNAVFLQFRFELTGGGNDTPELVRVLLKLSE